MTPNLSEDLKMTAKSIAKLRCANSDVVLLPGYTEDGKFGYFIAHEFAIIDDEHFEDSFHYVEIAFSTDYEHAVTLFKQHTANKA